MKKISLLLFPYFLPLVTLSIVAFIYMLATPPKLSGGSGPAGGDVLGLYFIGVCILIGGALQMLIGLPLNILLLRTRRFRYRLLISTTSVLIPSLLYIPVMLDTPSTPTENYLGLGFVVATFGLGAYFVSSIYTKDPL